jgi:Fe-S cluster biogenesis protein NfuA
VTDRADLAGFLGDIERLRSIFDTWDETRRGAVEDYRRAIEAINGEALRRLVRALKTDPAALAAMTEAAGDEVVYAVLRRHDIVKASLSERVEVALAAVRPMLATHGGDVELVKIAPPSIDIRFLGACDGCAASTLTFHAGVKKAVHDACPEIAEVRQVKGIGGGTGGAHLISPFASGGG